MLNKLEFEVQKYGKDVTYFVDTHEELVKKSKHNLFMILFTAAIILVIFIGVISNNFVSHEYLAVSSQIFINALIYSSLGMLLAFINMFLIMFVKLLHPKAFSQEVIRAASPASVMDMDKYKDLVQRVTKVNHETDARIKAVFPILSFLNFHIIIMLLLAFILIIESVLIYFKVLPNDILRLMGYLSLFK